MASETTAQACPVDEESAARVDGDDLSAQKAAAAAAAASRGAPGGCFSRRRAALVATLALLCLGIGLGVGLGVGLARDDGGGDGGVSSAPATPYTHVITAVVSLQGYSVATFNAAAQASFVATVAATSSAPPSGVSVTSVVDDVAVRRRMLLQGVPSVTVAFAVRTAGVTAATAASNALSVALASPAAFLAQLNAALAAAGLPPVTALTVVRAPLVAALNADGSTAVILFDGALQKGPFIFGSTILVSELNADLSSRGVTHLTQTSDSLGQFTLMGGVSSPIVDILGDGFFFDELSGTLSSAPIKLRGFANLTQSPSVTINLLTTLQTPRLKSLMLGGASFSAAYAQSQRELLGSFGIGAAVWPSLGSLSAMNLNGTSDSSAVGLAISALVLQAALLKAQSTALVPGQLSLLLSQLAFELNEQGAINSSDFKASLAAASAALEPATVTQNLLAYYGGQGSTISLPAFADWVDADGSGNLPHRTTVATSPFSFAPTVAYVPGGNVSSVTVTVAGLPPGVRAAVKLYVATPSVDGQRNGYAGTYGPDGCPFASTGVVTVNNLAVAGSAGSFLANPNASFTAGVPTLSKNGGAPLPADACPSSSSEEGGLPPPEEAQPGWQAGSPACANASVTTTAMNGDTFTLSTRAGDFGWSAALVLRVGGTSATWAVSTAAPTPAGFAFEPQTVEALSSPVSNVVTVAGLPDGVATVFSFACWPNMRANTGMPLWGGFSPPPLSQCAAPQLPGTPAVADGGAYASLLTVTLNGAPATSITSWRQLGVAAGAPTTLNGFSLGLCQLAVRNGDTLALSLVAPGDNAGVFGLAQSFPIGIGALATAWNVTVRKPTVTLAQGPTTVGNSTYFSPPSGGGGGSGGCAAPASYNYGTKGDASSLYYAVPFAPAAALSAAYVALGIDAYFAQPDSVSIVADAGGSPGATALASSSSLFFYVQSSTPYGVSSPATSPLCSSYYGTLPCPASLSTLQGAGGPYTLDYLQSRAMLASFASAPPQLSAGATYWLILHFPSNAVSFSVFSSGVTSTAGALLPKLAGNARAWSSIDSAGACAPMLYIFS